MTIHMPSLRDVTFHEMERNYGEELAVCARYETRGPCFVAEASRKRRTILPSEVSRVRTELYRQAFNDVHDQVQAHRNVIEPIPNH